MSTSCLGLAEENSVLSVPVATSSTGALLLPKKQYHEVLLVVLPKANPVPGPTYCMYVCIVLYCIVLYCTVLQYCSPPAGRGSSSTCIKSPGSYQLRHEMSSVSKERTQGAVPAVGPRPIGPISGSHPPFRALRAHPPFLSILVPLVHNKT